MIAIIGILATVAIPSYREYVNNAKLAEGSTGVEAITKLQRIYYSDYGLFLSAHTAIFSPAIGSYVNAAISGGSKQLLDLPINEGWDAMGFPFPDNTPSYFHFQTFGFSWDAGGTKEDTATDNRGNLHVLSSLEFKDKSCANTFTEESLSITSARNKKMGVIVAAAGLKVPSPITAEDFNCSFLIQTITADGNEIQTSPTITIRE